MKIGFIGFDLPEGKVKLHDPIMAGLEKKFEPKKVSPFFAEFIKDNADDCEGVLVAQANALDVFIRDMEKLEARKERAADEAEKALLDTCLAALEQETPLCDLTLSDADAVLLKSFSLLTSKPTIVEPSPPATDDVITRMLDKAGLMFFYTGGKQEVHAWLVKKSSDIVTCAGKIHTDLARGFIRADVVKYKDLMTAHNLYDAKAKGLVKVVERDYIIEPEDVIEIRFSV